MGGIRNETVLIGAVTAAQRQRMFELMEASYYGMERDAFEGDLEEKEAVFFLIDAADGRIVGFSTVTVLDLDVRDSRVKAIFSGDTIVEDAHRHSNGLGLELGKFFRSCMRRFPSMPIFWLLTSKGCRTYGLLPILFKEFFPRYDAPTPDFHAELMRVFGALKYPSSYHPAANLVRHGGDPQRLKPGVADAAGRRLDDPHTRFFVAANPGHMRGDDLVCAAEVREENFSRLFLRLLDRT